MWYSSFNLTNHKVNSPSITLAELEFPCWKPRHILIPLSWWWEGKVRYTTNVFPFHPLLWGITLRIRLRTIFSALAGVGNHASMKWGIASGCSSQNQVEPKGHQGHWYRGNELLQTKLCSYSLPKGENPNPNHSRGQRKACSSACPASPAPLAPGAILVL